MKPAEDVGKRAKRSPEKFILDRLSPGEAQTVLNRLLAAHPDLRAEAERIAASILGEISLETVAWAVEDAVRAVDLDDLNSRAGRHSSGYTEPGEAAWELLQEAVQPFVEDMQRRLDLGLAAEAFEVCKGILLGLYDVRDAEAHEIVGWAPDFPEETAAETVATWFAHGTMKGTLRREHARLLQEFARKSIPEWSALLQRTVPQR